jgi:hypothetical protein
VNQRQKEKKPGKSFPNRFNVDLFLTFCYTRRHSKEEIQTMKTDKVIDGVLFKATQPKAGEHYVWPEGVTKIGEYAFDSWTSFNQPFSIPEGVTEIGEYAFFDWDSFNQTFSIPEGVTEIGACAFSNWKSFNQPFSIPEGVTKIEKCAFLNWYSFNQIFSIPESVIKIVKYAFLNWNSFNQPFSITEGVTEIGAWAFSNWNSFNQPNSRRTKATNKWFRIDNWVFAGCYSGKLEQLRKRLDSGESTPEREKAWKIISQPFSH